MSFTPRRAPCGDDADPQATQFYDRRGVGFEASPTDPLYLILLMKDLRAAIRAAAADSHASED
jgi:hypothetical protein